MSVSSLILFDDTKLCEGLFFHLRASFNRYSDIPFL